jgi:hypothetical protein
VELVQPRPQRGAVAGARGAQVGRLARIRHDVEEPLLALLDPVAPALQQRVQLEVPAAHGREARALRVQLDVQRAPARRRGAVRPQRRAGEHARVGRQAAQPQDPGRDVRQADAGLRHAARRRSLRAARQARDERHTHGRLVQRLAVPEEAVLPELLAVVAGQQHERVVREAGAVQRVQHLPHELVGHVDGGDVVGQVGRGDLLARRLARLAALVEGVAILVVEGRLLVAGSQQAVAPQRGQIRRVVVDDVGVQEEEERRAARRARDPGRDGGRGVALQQRHLLRGALPAHGVQQRLAAQAVQGPDRIVVGVAIEAVREAILGADVAAAGEGRRDPSAIREQLREEGRARRVEVVGDVHRAVQRRPLAGEQRAVAGQRVAAGAVGVREAQALRREGVEVRRVAARAAVAAHLVGPQRVEADEQHVGTVRHRPCERGVREEGQRRVAALARAGQRKPAAGRERRQLDLLVLPGGLRRVGGRGAAALEQHARGLARQLQPHRQRDRARDGGVARRHSQRQRQPLDRVARRQREDHPLAGPREQALAIVAVQGQARDGQHRIRDARQVRELSAALHEARQGHRGHLHALHHERARRRASGREQVHGQLGRAAIRDEADRQRLRVGRQLPREHVAGGAARIEHVGQVLRHEVRGRVQRLTSLDHRGHGHVLRRALLALRAHSDAHHHRLAARHGHAGHGRLARRALQRDRPGDQLDGPVVQGALARRRLHELVPRAAVGAVEDRAPELLGAAAPVVAGEDDGREAGGRPP